MKTLAKSFLVAILLILIPQLLAATVYYVDAINGNDNYAGTSEALAWKTIAKVNTFPFAAGDEILFKRGNIWRETLTIKQSGSAGNPITFGAFASGPKPRILGSSLITSWTFDSGSIWKATLAATVKACWFLNTAGTISWGDKKTAKVNCVNEYDWYSDVSFVYIYSPTDPNSRYSGVEGTIRDYGFDADTKSYITIDGFEISYCYEAGIRPWNGTGWIIQNNLTSYMGCTKDSSVGRGIIPMGCADLLVQNNIVHDIGLSGIMIYAGSGGNASTNFIVQNNIVYNAYHSNIDIMGYTGNVDGGKVRYNLCYQASDFDTSFYDGSLYYAEGGDATHNVKNVDFEYNIGFDGCPRGIQIYGYCENINILNNTFYGQINASTLGGIRIENITSSGNIVIKNNICMNISGGCLWVSTTSVSKISACDYNCWHQSAGGTAVYAEVAGTSYHYNDFAGYKIATGWDYNGKWEDPKFPMATNHDFHLQFGSSCIDAGTNLSLIKDFYGANVPFGAGTDIGVSEYTGTGSPLSVSINGSPTSGQAPLAVNFTGSASGGTSPYSYSWTFGDGGSSTTQNPSHTYSSAGTYTATLTVTDSKSATNSKSLTITVTATTPALVASASASPTSGQAPLIVNFTGSASGGTSSYSYSWAFGDGGSSTTQNPSHTYSSAGTYTATLTVTDSSSANANATVSISVGSTTTATLALAAETGAPAPGQGGTTDPSPGNHSFSTGSTVSVKSIPNTNYRFSKWGGDIAQSSLFNSATTLTMNNNKSLSATFCTKCADVNGDLKITPADAQFAFDIYLGKIGNPTWCELENADVKCDGTKLSPKVTPSDAQWIFNKYLKKGVMNSNCSGNSRTGTLSTQSSGFTNVVMTLNNATFTPGQDILIPVIIESSSEIKSFGFDLAFPSDVLQYVGLESTELTKDYDQLDANVISYEAANQEGAGQILRVGGFKTNSTQNPSSGVLVTLIFRVTGEVKDPSSISVIAAYDDIQNASLRNGMISRQNDPQIRENRRLGEKR
jgi:PKD repeat protein